MGNDCQKEVIHHKKPMVKYHKRTIEKYTKDGLSAFQVALLFCDGGARAICIVIYISFGYLLYLQSSGFIPILLSSSVCN